MKIIISESQLNIILEDVTASDKSVDWAKRFKKDLGLTNAAAAAMAANIEHESRFKPDAIQIGFGPSSGTLSQSGKGGYSWAQWTFGTRKKAFRNYVLTNFGVDINKTPATSEQAYSFLKYELLNPKNNYHNKKESSLKFHNLDFDNYKSIKDVGLATKEFVTDYEMAGEPMLEKRKKIAQDILKKMTGQTTTKPKKVGEYYTVKSGDTLSGIAKKKNISIDSIKKLNNLKSDTIKIGQELRIK